MNPASERLLQHFEYGHLVTPLKEVSEAVAMLAVQMASDLDSDNPTAGAEVTTGLRKLLEAKDCFVRAKVILKKEKTS